MSRRPALCRWPLLVLGGSLALSVALAAACSATGDHHASGASTATSPGGGGTTSATDGGGGGGGSITIDAPGCSRGCSPDLHSVIDCTGQVVQTCSGTDGCDAVIGTCANACQVAVASRQSVGCEYYATDMDSFGAGWCYAVFIGNTWDAPAHITVDFAGAALPPIQTYAYIPSGAGPTLTYAPYDPTAGLPPGEVAILFLAGDGTSMVPCPKPPATVLGGQISAHSDIGDTFHVTADVPVVAYQMNPYGGGKAAVGGASLLLPVSAWGRNYVAVMASPYDVFPPSMNVIAAEDGTEVTMLPAVDVAGGGQLLAGPAGVPYTFTLNKGQEAQFTQSSDLSGSILASNKPVGFMAGQRCMRWPAGVDFCDHAEQMLPPVKALGSEYVGVMFRPRVPGDMATWRLVGAVDGTVLTYSSNVGGVAGLAAGQVYDFTTDQPFVVKSQDASHPFMLFAIMSGSTWSQLSNTKGYGDPDFVVGVPPQQYLSRYVFFADPTYPETNLVVVRSRNGTGTFDDVTLDCSGPLTGWQPVGDYEWTRVDLVRHDFVPQGNCATGAHEIESKSPFGLWVWGWGSPETTQFSANVSYGYPGGMNVQQINQVVIVPSTQ